MNIDRKKLEVPECNATIHTRQFSYGRDLAQLFSNLGDNEPDSVDDGIKKVRQLKGLKE